MRVQAGECLLKRGIKEPSIVPEGCVCAIADVHPCQVLIALHFTRDKLPKVGVTRQSPANIRMRDEPLFLGKRFRIVKLVDEFKKKAVVHFLKAFYTKAA